MEINAPDTPHTLYYINIILSRSGNTNKNKYDLGYLGYLSDYSAIDEASTSDSLVWASVRSSIEYSSNERGIMICLLIEVFIATRSPGLSANVTAGFGSMVFHGTQHEYNHHI